jgi:exodeoxyribonuclease-3
MKIISWNVNGLRAALARDALGWAWAQGPDALCLQEVKARPDQLSPDQRRSLGESFAWNPAERPGYSGVATFYKEAPAETRLGLGELSLDLEGRVLRTRHSDLLLYNVYFPNGQRGKARLDYKREFYARLLAVCDELHAAGENIIISGDFNTAHQPIDLKNPAQNRQNSGFLPEEREWLQRFLDHGFVDIYRRLYPDRVQYTWWTYRFGARARGIGWRIDYFLVSQGLVARTRDVIIHEEVQGSDHCPVELLID